MRPAAKEGTAISPGLAWSEGDFYLPGFAAHGRTALVPSAPDTHRRFFLACAAKLQPELLATLRKVPVDDERALSAWAEHWHLTDRWCKLLAHAGGLLILRIGAGNLKARAYLWDPSHSRLSH